MLKTNDLEKFARKYFSLKLTLVSIDTSISEANISESSDISPINEGKACMAASIYIQDQVKKY